MYKSQKQVFIDCCLLFDTSVSFAVFKDISKEIHWIVEGQASNKLIHYLDNFFTAHNFGLWADYGVIQTSMS